MKNLIVFLLLFAGITTANAQKKMVPIEIPVEMIGVDATPLFISGNEAVVISQNNLFKYRVTHDGTLELETQYFFILRVSTDCEKCEVRDAEIVAVPIKSPRQIARERNELIKKYLTQNE